MISIKPQCTEGGDEFDGVIVEHTGDGEGTHKVTVESSYPPLAIELLRYALVAMEEKEKARMEMLRKTESRF